MHMILPNAKNVLTATLAALGLVRQAAPAHMITYGVLTLAFAGTPLATAWATKFLIDGLTRIAPITELMGSLAVVAGTGLSTAFIPGAQRYLLKEMHRRVTLTATELLYGLVNRFGGLRNFESPLMADRIKLAQSAATSSPLEALEAFAGAVTSVITLVGFGATLVILSPISAVVATVGAAPALVLEVRVNRQRVRNMWELSPLQRKQFFYSELLTSHRAAKEIRLLRTAPYLVKQALRYITQANGIARKLDRRVLTYEVAGEALTWATTAACLLWAAYEISNGHGTVGDLTILLAALSSVQGAAGTIANDVALCYGAQLMFRNYLDLANVPQDLHTTDKPTPVPPLRQAIRFEDVWFRFSEDQPWILRGVSLTIPAGATTALVGENGAGKSTIIKLLCRFYDPEKGRILWDGFDIRIFALKEYRAHIGTVFQDFMEYDLTARENIGLGDVSKITDMAAITQAGSHADVHDDLEELPYGYETTLSLVFLPNQDKDDPRNGRTLSGGQWQRVALARSLMRREVDLLMLDEPSSRLDAEAEHRLHTKLKAMREGRTSVMVTHRMAAARNAEQIVVLADGVIAEVGNHNELMALDSLYARMYAVQAEAYMDP
ncbi:ABC transporter ATP-binding protein [Sphaerimonospora mesophila]|uniref:ABC transporter ATP-binding protein n=1 Tax=Sphaerimonospora mesophila TaxID=37483 RepID=UPI0006E2AB09